MAEHGLKISLTMAIRRIGRADKFVIPLLLFILLTTATAGVSAVLTGPDWASLWESLLIGLMVGWLLAIFRWPAWRSALLVIGLGLLFSLLFAGGINGKVLAVFNELFHLAGHISPSQKNIGVDFTPLRDLTLQVFSSTGVVFGRIFYWLKDLVIGQPSFDPVAAGFTWSIAVWLVAAWSGWMVEAGRNALVAVLPAVLLNLCTLSYRQYNSASIYLTLGLTLVLIAVVQYNKQEQAWNETKVAYPSRKKREISNISLTIAIILVVFSAFISSLSIQRILNWTSEVRRSPAQSESGLAKSLGIVPGATATPDAFSPIRNPGLPRELLIGAGPELSKEQVMSVEVKDLASLLQAGKLPALYWRSFTYDIYTGHGWSSSTTEQSLYQPNQLIQPDHLPGHILIKEVVRTVTKEGGNIYAAGEPVSVNVSTITAWRSSSDLFGIQTGRNGYEIQSLIPAVDENNLRTAGQAYPDWISQRYLTLPAEVPTRLKELAIQLTATEPTPYDRARAIEQYLRSFPYTLDVPRPPLNRDLVDYFVFDLQKGYCDYYASAMVVLARAAGIPARFAIGYTSGIYNVNSNRFMVSQADAHSWVEVYFPDVGWVPFEPTAGLPPIKTSIQPAQEVPPTSPTSAEPPSDVGIGNIFKYIGFGAVVLAVLTAIFLVIREETRLRRLKPQHAAGEVYRRMRRYGILLKVPLEGGETPYEFSDLLCTRIAEITQTHFGVATNSAAVIETKSIIRKIVRLLYQPTDIEAAATAGIVDQWILLRWRFRQMWIVKIWQSLVQNILEVFTGQAEKRHA